VVRLARDSARALRRSGAKVAAARALALVGAALRRAGRWERALELYRAARRNLAGTTPGREHVLLSLHVAPVAMRMGRWRSALHHLRVADRLCREQRLPERTHALNLLGGYHFRRGHVARARDRWEAAREWAEHWGQELMIADLEANLGALADSVGDSEGAVARYQAAIPRYERCGDRAGLTRVHVNLAISYRGLGDLGAADRALEGATLHARGTGDEELRALAILERTELFLDQGDAAAAEAIGGRALRTLRSLGDPVGAAEAYRLVARARSRQGADRGASRTFGEGLRWARRHAVEPSQAALLESRARHHRRFRRRGPAIRDLRAAAAIHLRLGSGEAALRLRREAGALGA
jgi:tetratricopeptide (TPR) repeat protein